MSTQIGLNGNGRTRKKLLPLVSRVRILQGRLLGKLLTLGFDLNVEAQLFDGRGQ
ncbi:hypothetical protein PQI08_07530 [Psychrobacter pacificensis]|uniref:hypothetical protein n=1 Tax=Psychrobacter pacificensis TaxID=112002 RepID=UPI00309DD930